MIKFLHALYFTTFWGWNLIFLAVTYLGILPLVGIAVAMATFSADIPLDFFLTLLLLITIPAVSTFLGAKFFSREPLQLFRLFYCVEAPLFLLCLLRLFVIRELTPASSYILSSIAISIFAFLGYMFYGYASERRSLSWMQLLGHSLMLLVGVYSGAVLLFYAVPFAGHLLGEFLKFYWAKILWDIFARDPIPSILWWTPWTLILFGMTCSLFVVMPMATTLLYINSGVAVLHSFAKQYGQKRAIAGALGVIVATITIFIAFLQQPQVQAFSLLDNKLQSDSDRQVLLSKSDVIREGLLNAYLSNYRYLSSEKDNNHIQAMYRDVFHLPKNITAGLQQSYNRLMSPFLYQGTDKDAKKAEKLYEQFFDTSIQKGEQAAITHALQSTYNRDEVKAGLLNLNERKVWLQQQNINIQEHQDWADVELYEVYENKTREVQEVFYSFSLPESAVITGLWLGDTADKSKRFEFVVSPRGAAQKVYNQQVRRERPVDPALLEQVGPRHYRLRAFPIPVKPALGETRQTGRPTEMHLWLSYKVMQQEKGWELPQLGEKRNIYWTWQTKRLRNSQNSKSLDSWVESYIPASHSYKAEAKDTQLNTPSGDYKISAKPLTEKDYVLPQNQRFAIILDSSFSMNKHLKELLENLNWLKDKGFANRNLVDNDADLYMTASSGGTPKRFDEINQFNPNKAVFYGNVQLKEMLQQFDSLKSDTKYDGILLVTDEGSYELSKDKKNALVMTAPLWMVHLGALPPAYDDATLKTIESSSGGVARKLPEVLRRLATKSAFGLSTVSVVDGYAWQMSKQPNQQVNTSVNIPINTSNNTSNNPSPTNTKGNTPTNNISSSPSLPFNPIAARQLILGLSREKNLDKLVELDAIHALAKNFKIVTPYSSMIVLVNDEQREQLKQAEISNDRFNRKVESGKENLTKPNNPFKTSVPEPSGGIVLGIVGILFFLFAKKR
jgi:putative PEP-CTERM system integral membrane protein